MAHRDIVNVDDAQFVLADARLMGSEFPMQSTSTFKTMQPRES